MRRVSVVLAVVAALVLTFLALTAHAEEAPVTILRAANTYDVRADGTYVNDYELEMRVANDAAARREGQQAISYSPNAGGIAGHRRVHAQGRRQRGAGRADGDARPARAGQFRPRRDHRSA